SLDDGTYRVTIETNQFYLCAGICIYIVPTTIYHSNAHRIRGNAFNGMVRAIEMEGASSILIDGMNVFERKTMVVDALSMVHSGGNSNNIRIHNNYFEDSIGGIALITATDTSAVSYKGNNFAPNLDGGQ